MRLAQAITSTGHRTGTDGARGGPYRGNRHRSARHRGFRRGTPDHADSRSRSARYCGRFHARPSRPARSRSRSLKDLLNRCRRWKGHKLGASLPHRQTFLSTWTTLIVSIKNPLDTRPAKSYCCLPSKPRGLEVSRSSSGVLMGDDGRPQDAACLSLTGRSAPVRRSRARRPRSTARAGLGHLGRHRTD
jgi:hypothetical protein